MEKETKSEAIQNYLHSLKLILEEYSLDQLEDMSIELNISFDEPEDGETYNEFHYL